MPKATEVITRAKVVIQGTINQVKEIFLNLKNTTFIQLWQKTEPQMNKTGNRFHGLVNKTNCLNCVTNYSYAHMVNNARDKQALTDFRDSLESTMIAAGVPIDKIEGFFNGVKSDVTDNVEQFKSHGLSWGNYVGDSKCVIEHTTKSGQWSGIHGFYLQVAVLHSADPVYTWKDTGKALAADEVEEMKTFFPKKIEGARQGLAKPYIIRSPRFDTIESVTVKGANYKLVD